MDEKRIDIFWNIVLGALIAAYIVLTTAIFVVHRKLALLEQNSREASSAPTAERQSFQRNDKESELLRQLSTDAEDAKTRGDLAQFYYRQGERAKTIEQYEEMLERRPHDPEVHLALGRLYMGSPGTGGKAKNHLERVLELEPAHPRRRIVEIWIKQLEK